MTTVPERWIPDGDNTLALAQVADAGGIDFLLPIARWRGYGGRTDPNGYSFETLAWATGILAVTRRITVFATVHVSLVHPVLAAKQMATADQFGHGRLGLNIVCGWNPEEFAMFGGNQRPESERYAQGREWITVVRQLWRSQDLVDFEGKYYTIRGARCTPRLYQGTEPILMNAGRSAEGRQFAVEVVDCLFTSVRNPDDAKALVADIRGRARALGREVDVYTTGYVVCRPTRREAEEYLHYYAVENRDEEAMAQRGRLRNEDAESLAAWAAGHHGWPLIGTPDDVAQGLAQIASTGIAGVALGLVNYLNELPYFCQEVLPRLQRLGIR
ncbi:MAG: LLM class flavin-dependent oxidoreductase [Firmicutes bacterium]|nr:LLM class flavin-dependent oxidoreductase [Bacillota bacterium]